MKSALKYFKKAAFTAAIPLLLFTSSCKNKHIDDGRTLDNSEPEIEQQITLNNHNYDSIYNQLKSMEEALQNFMQKTKILKNPGTKQEFVNKCEIQDEDIGVVYDLQKEMSKTHKAILMLLSNPRLNYGGRFSAVGTEVAGSIGDAEKSLLSIHDIADYRDWIVDIETLQDVRRLHHESQAFRADLASIPANFHVPENAVTFH